MLEKWYFYTGTGGKNAFLHSAQESLNYEYMLE